MAQPCRVLILNERDPEHPRQGGAELHVHEIFSRLAQRGYEVTLACSGFEGGAREGCVAGELFDGTAIVGCERIHVLGPSGVGFDAALRRKTSRAQRPGWQRAKRR